MTTETKMIEVNKHLSIGIVDNGRHIYYVYANFPDAKDVEYQHRVYEKITDKTIVLDLVSELMKTRNDLSEARKVIEEHLA